MWNDITRGVAVLRGTWGDDSAVDVAEKPVLHEDFQDEFLASAQLDFERGRHQSAAILAGDALEETLRKLCMSNRVELPKKATVAGMNAELIKVGLFDDSVAQQLAELTELRDKAACGLWSEFSTDDVATMLHEVRTFVADHATN
jgi:uncharacterized protein (UPF0332 family)